MGMQQETNALLQAIYDNYQAPLRRIARGYRIPECDIDDVVQETFIAYFSNYSLHWSERQKRSMLIKILKHKCIDCLRKNGHYIKVNLDSGEFLNEADLLMRFVVQNPEDIIEGEEAYEEILREIEHMRPEWREIVMLYFVEERSISEVCEILGITGTVCCSRIYRARCCLKRILRPWYGLIHSPALQSEK